MAEQMIRLSGHAPYTDIPIVYTGIRPGEKFFEEILTFAEEGKFQQLTILRFLWRGRIHYFLDSFFTGLAKLERLVFPPGLLVRYFLMNCLDSTQMLI